MLLSKSIHRAQGGMRVLSATRLVYLLFNSTLYNAELNQLYSNFALVATSYRIFASRFFLLRLVLKRGSNLICQLLLCIRRQKSQNNPQTCESKTGKPDCPVGLS
jgi:hypothetical protein